MMVMVMMMLRQCLDGDAMVMASWRLKLTRCQFSPQRRHGRQLLLRDIWISELYFAASVNVFFWWWQGVSKMILNWVFYWVGSSILIWSQRLLVFTAGFYVVYLCSRCICICIAQGLAFFLAYGSLHCKEAQVSQHEGGVWNIYTPRHVVPTIAYPVFCILYLLYCPHCISCISISSVL